VITLEMLHNSEYFGNAGLSLVRPLEATTNSLRRNLTIGVSNRQVIRGKLFETTIQWTRRHDTDLAKGIRPLEVHPERWSGNYYSDRLENLRRFHAAQTVAWDTETGGLKHRVKAGGEFDWVDSRIELDRRPFSLFDELGNLKSLVTFDG